MSNFAQHLWQPQQRPTDTWLQYLILSDTTARCYPTSAAPSRPQSVSSLHKTTDTASITHCATNSQNEAHSKAEHWTTTNAMISACWQKFCSHVRNFCSSKQHKSGCQMSSNQFTDMATIRRCFLFVAAYRGSVAYRGGFGVFKPPPEITKALQNRAKLNPIVKTVKNCRI